MKIFMVFLTMYYMSWGISYFYENLLLEFRQCNTIYAMRTSDGRFMINRKCFLITYSIEIFYFHIYDKTFHGLSNNILHVLGTKLFL